MEDDGLFLTAFETRGQDERFDGSLMPPGIHLRWSFDPRLGFPPHGFRIERRLYTRHELLGIVPEERWELLENGEGLRVSSSIDSDSIFSRIIDRVDLASAEYYRASVREFMELLRFSESIPSFESISLGASRRLQTKMRPADLLFFASLDPFVARLLGLYYIDGSVQPKMSVDYHVTGLWGSIPWPWTILTFDRARVDVVATGSFRLGDTSLLAQGSIGLEADEENRQLLRLSIDGELLLRLAFDKPVGEVEIIFESAASADWLATNTLLAEQDGAMVPIRHSLRGSTLNI